MISIKQQTKSGIKKPRSSELLIIPTEKLLNWYKYEKEVWSMETQCLACGHKKTNYKTAIVGLYFICAWIFAIEVLMMILQNRLL